MKGTALTEEQRLSLLRRELRWAEEKTAFYRTAFARAGVSPASVMSFADMAHLPFWERAGNEGADAPFFMLTLPLSGVLRVSVLRDGAESDRIHCYTQGDVARQVVAATDMLTMCGVNRASTVLLMGNFTDSRMLDLQYALDAVGAAVLPCMSGDEATAQLLDAVVPDTVIAWEHDLSMLVEEMGAVHVHRLITVGDRIAAGVFARAMAARMGAHHAHIFTLVQMGTLIGCSCEKTAGIHLEEQMFFAEVVDAKGRSSMEDGAQGELVLSTLTAEAIPILRYRTGLRVRLARGSCVCGSPKLRIMEE